MTHDGVLYMTISPCRRTEGWKGLFPDPPSAMKWFFWRRNTKVRRRNKNISFAGRWNPALTRLIFSTTVESSLLVLLDFLYNFFFFLFTSIVNFTWLNRVLGKVLFMNRHPKPKFSEVTSILSGSIAIFLFFCLRVNTPVCILLYIANLFSALLRAYQFPLINLVSLP